MVNIKHAVLGLGIAGLVLAPSAISAGESKVSVDGAVRAIFQEDTQYTTGTSEFLIKYNGNIGKDMDATVITSVTDQDSSDDSIDVEEAYIEIDNVFGTLFDLELPNVLGNIDVKFGKQRLHAGRRNSLYFNNRMFITRTQAVSSIYGFGGLRGNGLLLSTVLPTPALGHLELGTFEADNNYFDDGEVPLFADARLFTLGIGSEHKIGEGHLEVSMTGIFSQPFQDAKDEETKVSVYSYSAFYKQNNLFFEGEFTTGRTNDNRSNVNTITDRNGYYLIAGMHVDADHTVAIRFSADNELNGDFDGDDDEDFENALSLLFTRSLSDSADLRFEYTTYSDDLFSDSLVGEFVFNI